MSTPKNTYTRPVPPTLRIDQLNGDTKEEEYDHNFMFEVKTLRSDRVELRPFVVSEYCPYRLGRCAYGVANDRTRCPGDYTDHS